PTEDGLIAHAFFYPPRNRDFVAPENERPPLLVMSHGGPTAATSPTLRLSVQYWTSRGVAVLDVNYGGSPGDRRGYREPLSRHWGVVDVDDCVNGRSISPDGGWLTETGWRSPAAARAATQRCARSHSATPSKPARAITA